MEELPTEGGKFERPRVALWVSRGLPNPDVVAAPEVRSSISRENEGVKTNLSRTPIRQDSYPSSSFHDLSIWIGRRVTAVIAHGKNK